RWRSTTTTTIACSRRVGRQWSRADERRFGRPPRCDHGDRRAGRTPVGLRPDGTERTAPRHDARGSPNPHTERKEGSMTDADLDWDAKVLRAQTFHDALQAFVADERGDMAAAEVRAVMLAVLEAVEDKP